MFGSYAEVLKRDMIVFSNNISFRNFLNTNIDEKYFL